MSVCGQIVTSVFLSDPRCFDYANDDITWFFQSPRSCNTFNLTDPTEPLHHQLFFAINLIDVEAKTRAVGYFCVKE